MGGKVQAPAGYADHVVFRDPEVCSRCDAKLCVEMCSGQAITRDARRALRLSTARNASIAARACGIAPEMIGGKPNIEFRAGAGGLHSAEN